MADSVQNALQLLQGGGAQSAPTNDSVGSALNLLKNPQKVQEVQQTAAPAPETRDESYTDTLKRMGMAGARGFMEGGPLGAAYSMAGQSFKTMDNLAYKGGGAITDLTGSPEAGIAANLAIGSVPMFVGGNTSKLVGDPATQGISRWLMRSALKPSSTVPEQKAAAAVNTMLEEGANPTFGGVDKLRRVIGSTANQVAQKIGGSGAMIDTHAVADYVPNAMRNFQNGPLASNAIEDLGNVQRTFLEHPNIQGAREIPIQVAQDMKQGYQRAIGDKGYGELKTPITEGEKQVARGLRELIAQQRPDVVEPLQREAAAIQAMKLAQRRAQVEANKNPLGMGALISKPWMIPIWLWDRSAMEKAMAARALYSSQLPALSGIAAGDLYGNRGALYQQ